MEPKDVLAEHLFSIIFLIFSEDRFWDAFWSPFGSLLAPFWRPLAPFWRLLAPFWLPLGSLWLTFCSFWLTFAHPGNPFTHFWRLLVSFLIRFQYFRRKSHEKSHFSMFFFKCSTFYTPASANHLQTNRRSPFFVALLLHFHPSTWHGAEFAVGT